MAAHCEVKVTAPPPPFSLLPLVVSLSLSLIHLSLTHLSYVRSKGDMAHVRWDTEMVPKLDDCLHTFNGGCRPFALNDTPAMILLPETGSAAPLLPLI